MVRPFIDPMHFALEEARAAARAGEVPVGAVVTRNGQIVASGRNRMRAGSDPTAHAELVAIRAAAERLGSSRLDGCDLWVTLEPCAMCAGAIALARIDRLYFGADDPKGGAVLHGPHLFGQPTCHHAPEVFPGIGEDASGDLLRSFSAIVGADPGTPGSRCSGSRADLEPGAPWSLVTGGSAAVGRSRGGSCPLLLQRNNADFDAAIGRALEFGRVGVAGQWPA